MQACVIALLAALVTACAVLTPLQQRAIDQASARVQLGRASASAEVLQLESSGFLSSFYTGGGQPAQALTPDQLYDEVPAPIAQAFGRPIGGQYLRVSMSDPRPSEGVLAWRTDACAHVRLVTGQCPEGARQIAVSTADAHLFGWDVGATVTVLEVQPSDAREKPRRMALTVAGTPDCRQRRPRYIFYKRNGEMDGDQSRVQEVMGNACILDIPMTQIDGMKLLRFSVPMLTQDAVVMELSLEGFDASRLGPGRS